MVVYPISLISEDGNSVIGVYDSFDAARRAVDSWFAEHRYGVIDIDSMVLNGPADDNEIRCIERIRCVNGAISTVV